MPNRYRIVQTTQDLTTVTRLGVEQGNYIYTGNILGLDFQTSFEIEQGLYTLTGQNVTLNRIISDLDANQGSYSVTGQDVNINPLNEPIIVETKTQQFSTLQQAFTMDLTDLELVEDDLLVLMAAGGKSSTLTASMPTGWFGWHNNLTPSDNRFLVGLREVTGGELSVTVNFSTNVTGCMILYQIRAWGGSLSDVVGGGISEGTSISPDPPNTNPPWDINNTLWLPMCMVDLSTSVTDPPTNFENLTTVTSGAGNTNALGAAHFISAVDALDPDAFTIASSQAWQTVHMAISQITPLALDAEVGVYSLTGQNVNLIPPSVSGSRAGDEEALEDLYVASNGGSWSNDTGWSSNGMSLSDNIFGVSTATISGELRVTEINLRENNLTGSINTSTLSNLTELELFAVYYNNLDTVFPQGIVELQKLRYAYFSMTGNNAGEMGSRHPHEWIADDGQNQELHTGKEKGDENNVITGTIPAPSNPSAMNLEWFICDWTDTSESVEDGLQAIDPGFFNISTFVTLHIYENRGIAPMNWPSAIGDMHNLYMLSLGGAHSDTGFLTGSIPGNLENLTDLRYIQLGRNTNLTIDFDVTDFRQFNLRSLIAEFSDVRGTFPPYMTDGSQQDITFMILSWPSGPGMDGIVTGPVNEDDESLQGCMLTGHNLDEIDPKFWNHIDLINQNFAFNDKLTTIGTDDLTHMSTQFWKLRNLRWYNCSVQGRWPNLAWGTDQVRDLTRFRVHNNQYNFEDVLWRPNTFNPGNDTIYDLYIAHGNSIGGWLRFDVSGHEGRGGNHAYSLDSGDNVTLDDFTNEFTHSGNNYQWEKDGSNISGADEVDLVLTNVDSNDEGEYQLKVTNSGAPQVGTIRSGIISVEVD